MPPLAAVPGSSALNGGQDAGRLLPASASSTGDAVAERQWGRGARRQAPRGKGCWLPLLLESASLPLRSSHPAAPRKMYPLHTVESICVGNGEGICLSPEIGTYIPLSL